MELTLADQYYLKAVDNFPYELSEVLENLNYALSYDENHCQANCLMGQVFMYHLKQFEKSEFYFNQAMQADLTYPDTIKYLSLLKIWLCEFDQALKIIKFGMSVKGMNIAILLTHKALVYECQGQLNDCKKTLLHAENNCFDTQGLEYVQTHLKRVNAKIKRIKKASKKEVAKMKLAPSDCLLPSSN